MKLAKKKLEQLILQEMAQPSEPSLPNSISGTSRLRTTGAEEKYHWSKLVDYVKNMEWESANRWLDAQAAKSGNTMSQEDKDDFIRLAGQFDPTQNLQDKWTHWIGSVDIDWQF